MDLAGNAAPRAEPGNGSDWENRQRLPIRHKFRFPPSYDLFFE